SVVTVEGWAKWRDLGTNSRFFDFADASLQINLHGDRKKTPDSVYLEHSIAPAYDDLKFNFLLHILFTNQWVHLAAVAGSNFSKLYMNGLLLSTNEISSTWRPSPLPPLK